MMLDSQLSSGNGSPFISESRYGLLGPTTTGVAIMQVCMPFSPLASLKAFSIATIALKYAAPVIENPDINSNLSCCFDDISSS